MSKIFITEKRPRVFMELAVIMSILKDMYVFLAILILITFKFRIVTRKRLVLWKIFTVCEYDYYLRRFHRQTILNRQYKDERDTYY